MDIPSLQAHSVAEAHLYLMVTPCKLCGGGRTECVGSRSEASDEQLLLILQTRCEGCGFDSEFRFHLPESVSPASEDGGELSPARINPTAEPSRIIDVAQWLTLFRVISEAAAAEADAVESRYLGHEAAQCLEEGLKFYDEDNDLPPPEAMFHERSRQQLRDRPALFARPRLIGLRARLPTLTQMERRIQCTGHRRPRKWWKLW
ncbi:MAG: hypothetical protein KAV82_11560 [Phycisphaerae bacterium]|nr:hypothetical protein [Phycisphaerae bacterium]